MITHRPHHRRPADAKVPSDRGDRVGVLAHSSARLIAGPLGQYGPGADGVGLLGPGPCRAPGLGAAPDALAPHQHHRPPADRQVPYPCRAASMRLGPDSTDRAPDQRGCGLHRELKLTVALDDRTKLNPSRPSMIAPDTLPC